MNGYGFHIEGIYMNGGW